MSIEKKIKQNKKRLEETENLITQLKNNSQDLLIKYEDILLEIVKMKKNETNKDTSNIKYVISDFAKKDYTKNILGIDVTIDILNLIKGHTLVHGDNVLSDDRDENIIVSVNGKLITGISFVP
jgi:hypothetical protein